MVQGYWELEYCLLPLPANGLPLEQIFIIPLYYTSGNVGIGTSVVTIPNVQLQIASSVAGTATFVSIENADASSFLNLYSGRTAFPHPGIGYRVGSDLNFSTLASQGNEASYLERMRLTSAGNLGVGTTTPQERLVVVGNISSTGVAYLGTLVGNNLTGASGSIVTVDGAAKLGLGSLPTSSNPWLSTGTDKIYTNSFVGIGTSNPITELSILNPSNDFPQILVGLDNATYIGMLFDKTSGASKIQTNLNQFPIQLVYDGSQFALHISNQANQGKVGIGIEAPNEKLTVRGNSSVSGVGYFGTLIGNNLVGIPGAVVTVDGSGKLGLGTLPSNSNPWLSTGTDKINTNSFVGIGTNNPVASLDITKSGNTGILISATSIADEAFITLSGVGSQQIYFEKPGAGKQWKLGRENGTDDFRIGDLSNNFFSLTSSNDAIFSNISGFYINNNFVVDINGNITKINVLNYSFPNTTGVGNSFLRNDGAGNLTWETVPSSQWITTTNGIFYNGGVGNVVTSYNQFIVNSSSNAQFAIENLSTASNAVSELALISNANGGGSQYFVMGVNKGGRNFYIFPQGGSGDALNMDFSGNIGIGVASGSNIAAKLEVNGSARINQNLTVSGLSGAAGSVVTVDGAGRLGLGNLSASQWQNGPSSSIFYNGGTSISGVSTIGGLHIQGGNAPIIIRKSNIGANEDGIIDFYSTGRYTGSTGNKNITTWEVGLWQQSAGSEVNDTWSVGRGGIGTDFSINRSGNVAIGLDIRNPTEKLVVDGNVLVNNSLFTSGLRLNNLSGAPVGSILTINGTGEVGYGNALGNTNQWISASTDQIYTNSLVGIGISTPLSALHILDIKTGSNLRSAIFDITHSAAFSTNNALLLNYSIVGTGGTQQFSGIVANITGSTNNGSGNTPAFRAINDMSGLGSMIGFNANIGGTNTGSKIGFNAQVNGTGGASNIGINVNVSGATNNYAALFNGGSVGIGVSAPNEQLVVSGNTSISGTLYTNNVQINGLGAPVGAVLTIDATGVVGYGTLNASNSQWTTASTNQIFTNSFDGIRTVSPSAKLDLQNSDLSGTTFSIEQSDVNNTNTAVSINTSGLGASVFISNNNVSSISDALSILHSNSGNAYALNVQSGRTKLRSTLIDGFLTVVGLTGASGSVVTVNGDGVLGIGSFSASPWLSSGSDIYFNTGKVGIGTSAPLGTFEVAGTSNPAVLSVYNATTTSGVQGGIINMRSNSTNLTSPGALAAGQSLGTFGFAGYDGTSFGANGPQAEIRAMSIEAFTGASQGTKLVFSTTRNGNNVTEERLTIDQNGNIGIGTSTPTSKLMLEGDANTPAIVRMHRPNVGQVVGTMYEPETVAAASPIWVTGIEAGTYGYTIGSLSTGDVVPRVFINPTGNIGIGTTLPGANLDVKGTIRFSDFTTSGSVITVDGLGNLGMGTISTGSSWIQTTGGVSFTNDKIAIGVNTMAGTARFKVAGHGSMGGMLVASQSLINPVSTSDNASFVTLLRVPIFIPIGTNSLEGNFIGNFGVGAATADFMFNINNTHLSNTAGTLSTSPGLVGIVSMDVSSHPGGWITLEVQAKVTGGTDTAVLQGFSLIVGS